MQFILNVAATSTTTTQTDTTTPPPSTPCATSETPVLHYELNAAGHYTGVSYILAVQTYVITPVVQLLRVSIRERSSTHSTSKR